MGFNWRIGKIFGIPVQIDPSWLLILGFLTLTNAFDYLPFHWSTALTWTIALVMALGLFASVLLHELGHSLTAQRQGIRVNSITLFLFGGIAAIDREPETPGKMFQVAVAGPLVSIFLFGLLTAIAQLLPNASGLLTRELAQVNLMLAAFNLIPGLPLDGGQMFKAIVWKVTGNPLKGVRWAAASGQVIGWMAISLGLASLFLPVGGSIWFAVIGWFILRNAGSYNRITDLQQILVDMKASDAMSRMFRVLDANMSLRQFADEFLLKSFDRPEVLHQPYYAAADGRYRGMVVPDDLQCIERSEWEEQSLQAIVHPLDRLITVQEQAPILEVIPLIEDHQLRHLTVLSPAGAIAGVIDRADIVRAVAAKLQLQIAETALQQIRQEGRYPSDLPLQALAKASERLVPSTRQDPEPSPDPQ